MLDLMIVGLCALWGFAGYQVCTSRHRQRGLEADKLDVPNIVPPEWSGLENAGRQE